MVADTETAILNRVIEPQVADLSSDAARAILRLQFAEADHARMADLARRSNAGILTLDERRELERYVLVGDLLALLQSKARLSLQRHSSAA